MSAPAPSVAPTISLLPLYHCQVTAAQVIVPRLSGSVRVAVIATPTWGCNVDSITVPGSSTLVTLIINCFRSGRVTSAIGCLDRDFISIVELPASPPCGSSKSGELLNVSTPFLYVEEIVIGAIGLRLRPTTRRSTRPPGPLP